MLFRSDSGLELFLRWYPASSSEPWFPWGATMMVPRDRMELIGHAFGMGGQKRCVSLPIKFPQLRSFEPCWDCFASSGGTSPWCPVPSPSICPARNLLGIQGPSVVHDLRDPARHRDLGDSNRFGRLVKTPVIGPHSRHVIRVHSEHGTVLNGSTAEIPGCRKVTTWGQWKCVADRAASLAWNEFRVAWRVTHSVFYRSRIEGIPNEIGRAHV